MYSHLIKIVAIILLLIILVIFQFQKTGRFAEAPATKNWVFVGKIEVERGGVATLP